MADKNKSNPGDCPVKKTSIGGQALIEGIMMRGPQRTSMAVRNPEGVMVVESWDTDTKPRPRYYKWPFFRGVFGFIDSMKFGYKCLMRSAEIAGLESEGDKKDTKKAKKKVEAQTENAAQTVADETAATGDTQKAAESADAGAAETITADSSVADEVASVESTAPADDGSTSAVAAEKSANTSKTQKDEKGSNTLLMNTVMIIASILGVALALILFKALPETIYEAFLKLLPNLDGEGYGYQLLRSLFVGILKIFLVIGYMALVSLMKEIRRTFMYHGAEHKSIACYESGLELTVENVKAQRRFHPRCGTSFLILIVIVGVLITMFIPAKLSDNGVLNVVIRTLISIALLPVMMSFGYELIRLAGRKDNAFTRFISAPGIWLQRITTKEPEDGMI